MFGTKEQLLKLEFMTEYLGTDSGSDNFMMIDRTFIRTHASFCPTYNAEEIGTTDVNEVLAEFKQDVFAFLFSRKNEYQRLYDVKKSVYDPSKSLSITETGSNKKTGTEDSQKTIADVQRDSNYGEDTTSYNNGAKTKTNEYGAVDTSENLGQRLDTTDNAVAGYNTDAMSDATQTRVQQGQQANTTTTKARTDTEKDAAYTDSETRKARVDSETVSHKGNDTEVKSLSHTEDIKNLKEGNLGIRSVSSMMKDEVKLWDSFHFYETIFNDIIKNLCNYNDSGYDTLHTPLWNVIIKEE